MSMKYYKKFDAKKNTLKFYEKKYGKRKYLIRKTYRKSLKTKKSIKLKFFYFIQD